MEVPSTSITKLQALSLDDAFKQFHALGRKCRLVWVDCHSLAELIIIEQKLQKLPEGAGIFLFFSIAANDPDWDLIDQTTKEALAATVKRLSLRALPIYSVRLIS